MVRRSIRWRGVRMLRRCRHAVLHLITNTIIRKLSLIYVVLSLTARALTSGKIAAHLAEVSPQGTCRDWCS
jgi:hypothetical protein